MKGERGDAPGPSSTSLVVGGGVNGAGIARDAAGRGLKVLLCEKDDLAQGTSSRSGKLVHGGLRYLEYYEFRPGPRGADRARGAAARGAAHHLADALRPAARARSSARPGWSAWACSSTTIWAAASACRRPAPRPAPRPEGKPLQPEFATRLRVFRLLGRRCAPGGAQRARRQEPGAAVLTRTAASAPAAWTASGRSELADRRDGQPPTVRARCVVNAAGPWVEQVLGRQLGVTAAAAGPLWSRAATSSRASSGTGRRPILLQNTDKRVIFVNPYEDDLALCGTTDIPVRGRAGGRGDRRGRDRLPARVHQPLLPAPGEARGHRPQLLRRPAALRRRRGEPLGGDPRLRVRRRRRGRQRPPLLSVFGGKITTYRKLAEHALDKLRPFFPQWAGLDRRAQLPGGDMPDADFDAGWPRPAAAIPGCRSRWPATMPASTARGRPGPGRGQALADLGRHFGAQLYEREARYLVEHEWAKTAEDILDRRTKHGLQLTAAQKAAFADWLVQQSAPVPPALATA